MASCRLIQLSTEAALLDRGLDWGTLKPNLVIPSNGFSLLHSRCWWPDQDGYFLNTVGSSGSVSINTPAGVHRSLKPPGILARAYVRIQLEVYVNRGPQHRLQNTLILLIGAPRVVPPIWGKPNPYNPLYSLSFHFIFHVLFHLILHYSSFHLIFHYPNITPI